MKKRRRKDSSQGMEEIKKRMKQGTLEQKQKNKQIKKEGERGADRAQEDK
jgi:hypothetical protein